MGCSCRDSEDEGDVEIEMGGDPRDEDWIPDRLRRKHEARLVQGKFAMKPKQKLIFIEDLFSPQIL